LDQRSRSVGDEQPGRSARRHPSQVLISLSDKPQHIEGAFGRLFLFPTRVRACGRLNSPLDDA
ncbi:hypothetical protein, partial [Burkholderia multivorans]|uniref:hypothetical protein n=1 Tax=Burkholderia multivorans TaxID=87883 RepID=UPI0021C04E61